MNQKHLNRLLHEPEQWNSWRREHPDVRPDLAGATLNRLASKSTLGRSDSIFQHFQRRDFQGMDLHGADMQNCHLWLCNLAGVDLHAADLRGAEFRHCQLATADLHGADLRETQFISSDLTGARVNSALMGRTHFGYTKLGGAEGLELVRHDGASQIDQFTLIHSAPLTPAFLDACEVSMVARRMAELYTTAHPYVTCFISYSRRDEAYAGYLRECLTWAGVPSWFAPQDMRDETLQEDVVELERDLYNYVDEAERFLLVVSPHILPSGWVGKEMQRTRAPILPILIETMPSPDSTAWTEAISRTTQKDVYSHLVPANYSAQLARLLGGHFFDFRDWRNPTGFAYLFSLLLPHLRRLQ